MTALCLTLDYELFGSGRGDVFQHIVKPTNRLLSICSEHGIKLTIFFEVVEYWKLKEAYEKGETMGYRSNPALAMEEQVKKAYQLGHDIQLHIHPQWVNAKYENEEWILDLDYWRLPDVPDRADGTISMGLNDLVRKGKEAVESILHPIDPNYRCNIIRAGGYNIEPSERLLKVLKKNSFVADSSVYFGGRAEGRLSRYDYSKITEKSAYWFASGNSLLQGGGSKNGFLELPIYAKKMRRISKYDKVRIRSAMQNKTNSIEKFKNNRGEKSKRKTLRFLFEKEALTWDFCLFSKSKMNRFLQSAQKLEKQSEKYFHPFVLVGHPKDFYFEAGIQFLARQAQKNKLEFFTMTELVEKIKSKA